MAGVEPADLDRHEGPNEEGHQAPLRVMRQGSQCSGSPAIGDGTSHVDCRRSSLPMKNPIVRDGSDVGAQLSCSFIDIA
eukprot:5859508-Alexandrium_andersonii.AAC.1